MKKFLLSSAVSIALTGSFAAQAQSAENWPQRPITIIVPASAGGLTDTLTRALADGLATELGQSVVVENRPGASGAIAVQAAIRASDDGYTFLMSYPSPMINTPVMVENFPFDVKRELKTVAGVAFTELVMNVNASLPINTPQELIDWIKQQKGHLAYGSYGEGSYGHTAGHSLSVLYEFDAQHIPYKGEQPMLMAIASNDVPYGIGSIAASKTMQDTGKTRIIGALTEQRSQFAPDLPTFHESGFTDPVFHLKGGWYGLFARQNVPDPIVKKMEQAVLTVLDTPKMRERLNSFSMPRWAASAQAFNATWEAETPVYHNMLRLAGVPMYR